MSIENIPIHCAYGELADITTLVSNPRNPNQHPQKQIELLAKIIKNQGCCFSIRLLLSKVLQNLKQNTGRLFRPELPSG